MSGWKPPEFDSGGFCKVLLALGFKEVRKARHGRVFKHSKKKSSCRMPFFEVPNSLRNDRQFQKALVRDLVKCWDFTIDEIIEAFNG